MYGLRSVTGRECHELSMRIVAYWHLCAMFAGVPSSQISGGLIGCRLSPPSEPMRDGAAYERPRRDANRMMPIIESNQGSSIVIEDLLVRNSILRIDQFDILILILCRNPVRSTVLIHETICERRITLTDN